MTGDTMRVLVAEDDPIIRMLIVETLEDAGFSVSEASNGVEAVGLMDEPDGVDLIVTDFHMPGFNGVEVAKRARERNPAIPVLFVSARADMLAAAGVVQPYSALKKPFSMADLERKVTRLLGGGAS